MFCERNEVRVLRSLNVLPEPVERVEVALDARSAGELLRLLINGDEVVLRVERVELIERPEVEFGVFGVAEREVLASLELFGVAREIVGTPLRVVLDGVLR